MKQTSNEHHKFEKMSIPTKEEVEQFKKKLALQWEKDLAEIKECKTKYWELKDQV